MIFFGVSDMKNLLNDRTNNMVSWRLHHHQQFHKWSQSKLKFHDQALGMFVKMVGNNISMLLCEFWSKNVLLEQGDHPIQRFIYFLWFIIFYPNLVYYLNVSWKVTFILPSIWLHKMSWPTFHKHVYKGNQILYILCPRIFFNFNF
jgi:hypothetical protein